MDETTKEIVKHISGAVKDVTEVFNKFAGEFAPELGGYFGDKVKVHRAKSGRFTLHG